LFRKPGAESMVTIDDIKRNDILDLAEVRVKNDAITNGQGYVHPLFRVKSPVEKSELSGIVYIIKLEKPPSCDSSLNVLAQYVYELLGEEFYNVLRTKYQLGYVCSCYLASIRGHDHMMCTVQGADHNPHYYARRIEEFWDDSIEHINNLEKTLKEHKEIEEAKKKAEEEAKKSTEKSKLEEKVTKKDDEDNDSDSESSGSDSSSSSDEADLSITKFEKLKKTVSSLISRKHTSMEDAASYFKGIIYGKRLVLDPS
jgi:secreted Zn-dependent insulinase-like peptidase